VRELVQFYPHSIEALYLTEAAQTRYPEITKAAADNELAIQLATPQVVAAISDNAQQVLAVAKAADFPFSGTQDQQLAIAASSLIVILHNIRDPGNAGTVIRTADAVGADLVILTGDSVEVTNPKVIRSSVGSLFHLPVIATRDLSGIVPQLTAAGVQVFAAAGDGELNLTDPALDLTRPTAWIFGNEAWGLLPDDAALASHRVRIPIYGHAESLNLATAAAICLYATTTAQHTVSDITG